MQNLTGSALEHTYQPTPTSPLPPAAAAALSRLELAFAPSPVDALRARIARLEESLRIQCEGRDSDVVQMRNAAASEMERATAEGRFRSTVEEIRFIRQYLAELRLELAAAEYRKSECRANGLIAIGRAGRMSDLDADDLAHHVDLMAAARATLAAAGRLDLVAADDDHGRVKEPLPQRPRGPHPHRAAGVAS